MTGKARKLTANLAAEMAGVRPNTWRAYVARGHAPAPDGREELSRHPYWLETTVSAWKASRPGPGARTDLRTSL
jgi:hypothetical protein